ncbi:MAG: PAS domain S-box protein [Candidatus Brocadiales bacterium]|nr:PAS domain S-box protein [Candidatus Bathyanammoxibius sp.]
MAKERESGISRLKRAEVALQESEGRLHAVLDNVVDGIITINEKRIVQSFNSAAEKIFGYSPGEVIGRNVNMLMPEPYHSQHDQYIGNYLRTGKAKIIGIGREVVGRRKDGSTFPLDLAVSEVRLGGERLFTGIIRDITMRKEAEENLKRTMEELARSNAELQQFAYVASHDLQEPLRMVSSYMQLLERRYKDKLDKDAGEFINYAVDGAVRMERLILALLEYSRVGTRGKAPEPTDSSETFDLTVTNLKAAIEESGAEVTHGELPTVMADPIQLGQLFQNLIGNALKFRGDKPPKVHVSAEVKGGMCQFSVQDNGIGIEPQYAERIFVIFQQLHSREEYSGTGIGLSVCKKIVERYGGRIWVESKPGKGSIFYFTLPTVKG